MFYLTGNNEIISESLNRVVHFNASFLAPAPFRFVLLNTNLQTEQNKDFILSKDGVSCSRKCDDIH
jgi:hypothetical protein